MHARRLNEVTLGADWSMRPRGQRGSVTICFLVLYAPPAFKGYQCYVFPQNLRMLVILLCGKEVSPRVQLFKKSALGPSPLNTTEHVHKFEMVFLKQETAGTVGV